jgi:hypothetical protein
MSSYGLHTGSDVAGRSPEFEQSIAGLLVQSLIRNGDAQFCYTVWQLRGQWLWIRPIDNFSWHDTTGESIFMW